MPRRKNKNSKSQLKKKFNGKKQKAKPTNKSKQTNNKTKEIVDKDVAGLFEMVKEFNRDITINKLTVEPINGGPDLIEECDLKLTHGHRYGLIGYNGAGKSTLLKKLASGTIKEIPSYLRVVHTHQELKGDNYTVLQTVLKSDKVRDYLLGKENELKKEMDKFADDEHDENNDNNNNNNNRTFDVVMEELTDIVDRLNFIESDTAESRVSSLLNGLGFTDKMKNMKTKDLSGGWRMRASLCSALFIEPDLLLLDEPTNHLDFPSVLWLSEYISLNYSSEKTIVIVSHDRKFLNDCTTDIIHLNKLKLSFYTGNFDAFLKIRETMRVHQSKQYDKQQKVIKHNEEFIAKFSANKKWATQAQSRRKMLDRMEKIEPVTDDVSFSFEFPAPTRKLGNPLIINFDDVTFGYFGEEKPNTFILKDINLKYNYGQKVGVLGANGAGKSTLIKLIMNKVRPLFGTASLTNACQIGYFSQHHIDNLDLNLTPLEQLEKEFGSANATEQQLICQLDRFNISLELAQRKIGTLSGGQKSRITFAILTWYTPHLIIMDEPTNHLDIPTIDGLANALSKFPGSVLIVSHDQHFVETCCDEYWCVGNKKIKIFNDFNKCKSYSKTCKAPNNLPREYKFKKEEEEEEEEEEEKSILKPIETKNIQKKNKRNNDLKWEIDAEREIDKGLKKGLTPNAVLRHCKGWKAIDGDYQIVNKLGFAMFNAYFDDASDLDHFEFFKQWKNLLNYCIPLKYVKNQLKLVNIAVQCFITAYNDKKKKTINPPSYSFGLILESVVNKHNIINIDAINVFIKNYGNNKNENGSNKENQVALDQIKTFINNTIVNEHDDNSQQ